MIFEKSIQKIETTFWKLLPHFFCWLGGAFIDHEPVAIFPSVIISPALLL